MSDSLADEGVSLKSVDLTEQSYLGAILIVGSAVGSVVGVAALIYKDPETLVAIAAGAAWMLSICLLVANSRERRRVRELREELEEVKTEAAAARRQAEQWSVTANNVSQSVLTVLHMPTPSVEPALRPRRRVRREPEGAARPIVEPDEEIE